MEEKDKVRGLVDREEVRAHLFENNEGLEKAKFHLDIIDYILEERWDWNHLSLLQEELKKLSNNHLQEVVGEIVSGVDIQWYLLKSNINEIRGCLDALEEKNKALNAGGVTE